MLSRSLSHPWCSISQPASSISLLSHLLNTSHLLNWTMGGLLPLLQQEIQSLRSVLEIACGPGAWTSELAWSYPHLQVRGVDSDHEMIFSAKEMGARFPNLAYFQIPERAGQFPFKDAEFDLIRIQFIDRFMSDVPTILAECQRLLMPGGMLHLVTREIGSTNSKAHEELSKLILRAQLRGRDFFLFENLSGYFPDMERLLPHAGFTDPEATTQLVDYSYGAPLHEEWKRDFLLFSQHMLPILVEKRLATKEQVAALYLQQALEMRLPTFQAHFSLRTFSWKNGKK